METEGTRGSVIISDKKRRALSGQEEQTALDIIKSVMASLGKFQQYPTMNPVVLAILESTHKHLQKWLRTFSRFECVTAQGTLQVNNGILSAQAHSQDYVQAFIFYLTERNVRTIEFLQGITQDELQQFLTFFCKPAREIVAKANLSRAMLRIGVKHVRTSAEMVLDDVVIKTTMSDELSKRLSKLNVAELLEKANIISQLDINTLNKVGDLATLVTNLTYTKNQGMAGNIMKRLEQTLHGANPQGRLSSVRAISQIAEKAVDYTLFDLHSQVGGMLSKQLAREEDPKIFSALAQGLEKAAQVYIAKGDYDEAMKIVENFDHAQQMPGAESAALKKRSETAINNIGNRAAIQRLLLDLEGKDARKRNKSVSLLSQIGKKAVPELVDLIYTTDNDGVLSAAIEALMRIGPAASNELYAELKEEMHDRFRVAIIRIIGRIGDVHSVVRLTPFVNHANEEVADETCRSLLKIGGPAAETKVMEKLGDVGIGASFFRNRVIDFGACKNKMAVEPLSLYLQGKGPFARFEDDETKVAAIRSLCSIGGAKAVAGLSDYLLAKKGFLGMGKGNEPLEIAACQSLGQLGDPSAEKALQKAARSKFKSVQHAAERALGRIGKGEPEKTEPVAPPAPAPEEPEEPEIAPPYVPEEGIDLPGLEERIESSVSEDFAFAEDPPGEPQSDEEEYEFVNPDEFEHQEGSKPQDGLPVADGPADVFDDDFSTEIDTAFLVQKNAPVPEGLLYRVNIIPTIGAMILDNLQVSIPSVGGEAKMTANQEGVAFDLAAGAYEVMFKDKGMEVYQKIEVTEMSTRIKVDLQAIFNF